MSLILLRIACEANFGNLCVLSCIWMTVSNDSICFPVWTLPETAGILYVCNCLVGARTYTHYVIRSPPVCGVEVLHPAQYYLTRSPAMVTAKTKNISKKRFPDCLALAVIVVFYNVIANRRQPNLRKYMGGKKEGRKGKP